MSLASRRMVRAAGRMTDEPLDNPNGVRINGTQTRALNGTNITRGENFLVRYTRSAGQTVTPTNQFGVEVVVDIATNTVIAVNDRLASGDTAGTAIPSGTYVLSGHGGNPTDAGVWLRTYAVVGADIALIMIDITNFVAAAISSTQINLSWSYSGAPLANYTLRRDGSIIASPAGSATSHNDTGLTANTSYTYTLTGNYQAGGTTETVSDNATTQGAGGGGLPAKLAGAYHLKWASANTRPLAEVSQNYNLIIAAFATGQGGNNGRLDWVPYDQTPASYKADMQTLQARGQKIILSIGGADHNGFYLRTSQHLSEFQADFSAIQAEYGFDGIDWDMENDQVTWTIPIVKQASEWLKATYGSNFAVCCAAQPHVVSWKQWAQQTISSLDFYGMQFYDYVASDAQRITDIKNRLNDMINNYGVPASKLGIGCKTQNEGWEQPGMVSAPSVYLQAFDELEAIHPGLRGAYVWQSGMDYAAGWEFANIVGKGVRNLP